MKLSMFSDPLDLASQCRDAMTNLTAIHFQFGFTGTSSSDSAAQTRQVVAVTAQPGQSVVELGKFNLELSLFSTRAARKNIENEPGPIHDLCVENFFEVSRLAW